MPCRRKRSRASTTSSTSSATEPYEVRLTPHAQQDIASFDRKSRDRVYERLKLLPIPRSVPNTMPLVGLEGYRMRIGKFKVRYVIRDDDRTVLVTRVMKRDESTY